MKTLQHKFVESVPVDLENDVLYISLEYCTAIHKCVCGCGNEVVTPISPTGWKMTFDGKSITLDPSIGSWNLKCKSHYFIINSKIKYARKWSDSEIKYGRETEKKEQKKYF
jgi:hypothetical protein